MLCNVLDSSFNILLIIKIITQYVCMLRGVFLENFRGISAQAEWKIEKINFTS